jgi:quinol-cytochrome oxidoreductase complex cytochrome b subunit
MALSYILLIKSHLQSYPCPLQINSLWNLGFLLAITIILQIITGIFLGLHYTSDLHSAYSSIFFLIREVYYGWLLHYVHSSGASFVFLFQFIHLGRGLFYGSYFYNSTTWFSGIILLFLLMAIAFMGYVLPFGQMSFWGATVITNLLSPFPCLVEWVCGGYCVHNPTLKRFFLFHFILPFILCGFILIHLFYLHYHSSNNPLMLNTNNKISFFPFILLKDLVGLIIVLCLYFLQTHFGISSLSHPDNALEACALLTPLHIVPEWYFLCQYAMLKAIPNKNAGFIILITSILILFLFGEIRNITTFTRLMDCNNGFSISFFFLSFLSFLWIGAQFPQEKFLSYARILTLDFYFLIMCIIFLFSLLWFYKC